MDLRDQIAVLNERLAMLQEQLRESETRHRLLTESWAQAVWEAGPDGAVVADSPSWRAYTGQTLEEWLGYGWLDAIHPDDRLYAERQWRDAVAVRGLVDAEFRLRAPGGGWRWTNVRAAPATDAAGTITKWVGLNIDIDDRKRAQDALRRNEERLQLALEAADLAVYEWDLITDRLIANSRFCEMVGVAPDAPVVGAHLLARCVHPDDHARVDPELARAMSGASDGRFVFEHRLTRRIASGHPWVLSHGQVYFSESDGERRAVRVFGSLQDITERKQAEAALRDSEAKYRSLFETMGQGYAELEIVRDPDGRAADVRYLELNPQFERLTGVPVDAARGRTVLDLFPDLDRWWIEEYDRIVRSGQPGQVENEVTASGRWYQARIYPEGGERFTVLSEDVTVRKRAETILRESEERQAFLLRLSDALRAELDEAAVADRAIGMLFEHLTLDRCYIAYYRPDDDMADFPYQIGNDSVPPLPETVRLSDFPETYAQVLEGTFVIEDDFERRGLSDAERANSSALGMRAMVASTLRRGEKTPLGSVVAVSSRPRRWTPAEIALVEDAAERTWAAIERARTETQLRENEQRLRLALEVGHVAAWDWHVGTGEVRWSDEHYRMQGYAIGEVAPSYENWAARVHPDDLAGAEEALMAARESGGVYAHEYRTVHPDGTIRWLSAYGRFFPDPQGTAERMVGAMIDITDRRESAERQGMLLAELQHRVRNILAIIRSVVSRSDDGERSAADYARHLQGRLSALARTQVLLTRRAGVGVDLENMIRDELAAQIADESQYVLTGPDVQLSPKAAEVLTLAIHELATNATKYGAFARPGARLTVGWRIDDRDGQRWLALDWVERGVAVIDAVPRREGFGSELISRRIPYDLQGEGSMVLRPGGLTSHIAFPLRPGDSILQTEMV